jgi:hypothetical protein
MKHTRLARPGPDPSAEHARAASIDLQLPLGRNVPQALREQLRPLPGGEIEIIPDECDVSEHFGRALPSDREDGSETPHVFGRVVEDEATFLDPAMGAKGRRSHPNHASRILAVVRKESGEGQGVV